MSAYFIQPLDLLYFRGNRLFGEPGAHGTTLMPPWPSVFAGALRSHVLAQTGTDLAVFARGGIDHPLLGTPVRPTGLRILGAHPARRAPTGHMERFRPLPADVVVQVGDDGQRQLFRMQPFALPFPGSAELPKAAVLNAPAGKPETGFLLDESGWDDYLRGQLPAPGSLLHSSDLWTSDSRLGIALDPSSRAAADGALFTSEAVAMQPDCGFAVDVAGIERHPLDGMLRLGGDGRSARVESQSGPPPATIDPAELIEAGRCRIVLTAPGIFPEGWRLPGLNPDLRFNLHGVSGRLVCAVVPRAETVSGWDLALRKPKPAQRAAPAGSVYWLEDLEATPEAISKLADYGLWLPGADHEPRRTEGFNRFVFALY